MAFILVQLRRFQRVVLMCISLGLSILATRTSGGVGNTVLERGAPTKQSVPAGANPATPSSGAPTIPQPKIEVVTPGQAPATSSTPATVPPKTKKK